MQIYELTKAVAFADGLLEHEDVIPEGALLLLAPTYHQLTATTLKTGRECYPIELEILQALQRNGSTRPFKVQP